MLNLTGGDLNITAEIYTPEETPGNTSVYLGKSQVKVPWAQRNEGVNRLLLGNFLILQHISSEAKQTSPGTTTLNSKHVRPQL